MNKEQDTKRIVISKKLHQELKDFCKSKGSKMSYVSEFIIKTYLENNKHTIKKW